MEVDFVTDSTYSLYLHRNLCTGIIRIYVGVAYVLWRGPRQSTRSSNTVHVGCLETVLEKTPYLNTERLDTSRFVVPVFKYEAGLAMLR